MPKQIIKRSEPKSKNAFLLIALFVLTLWASTIVLANDSTCSISQSTLTFYFGIIERYTTFETDPIVFGSSVVDNSSPLYIFDKGEVCNNVVWRSGDTSIATVSADGRVKPVGYGTTTVTGTYNGNTYSCKVYVKEIQFYFWQEYTGEESSSRWAWSNSCCPSVGQSVPYKLIEITYGSNKTETDRKDVTVNYPLYAEAPDYIQISGGRIKALKPGTDQFDRTSGIFYVFNNTGVEYVQMIRLHVFTTDPYDSHYINNLRIERLADTMILRPIDYTGSFTYDDEFICFPGWAFYRYTPEEITWKSSNSEILTIERVVGSKPHNDYGTAYYSIHKKGTVEVFIELFGRKIVSLSINITDSDLAENSDTRYSESNTSHIVKRGTIIKNSSSSYIVKADLNTVSYKAPLKKTAKAISVPASVLLNGKIYKVTSVEPNAFKGMKNLKSVTIGANIEKIGKNAFFGCKKLKRITIKSSKLTKKAVGANAFKGIYAKATVKCPKAKKKEYAKFLVKKGMKKTVKFK